MPEVLKKVSLRLLPFMWLLYVIAYLDRINISFAGLQMNKELTFGDDVFGLGAGIFFIGYFIFGLPSNLAVEKIGARKWITSIMVLWGIISVSMLFVRDHVSFYVMRFLLGAAEAGFFPGMILYLTYWFPRKERAAAVGKFMSAIPAAGVTGGLVAAAVLPMTHMSLAGWQWLFLITGLPAVFLGAAVFFVLPDNPDKANWLTETEKETIAQTLAVDHNEEGTSGGIAEVIASPKVWLFAALYFAFTIGMYGFQLWLPQIIAAFDHTDTSTTALLSAIPAVFQAVGMVLIASHSDKKQERRWHVALSAWSAAAMLILAGWSGSSSLPHSAHYSLAALSLCACALWGVVGPFWALTTSSLPKSQAAAGIGLVNSVGNLGGFVGPYFVGVVKKAFPGSLLLPLSVLAISLVVAGSLALVVRKTNEREAH